MSDPAAFVIPKRASASITVPSSCQGLLAVYYRELDSIFEQKRAKLTAELERLDGDKAVVQQEFTIEVVELFNDMKKSLANFFQCREKAEEILTFYGDKCFAEFDSKGNYKLTIRGKLPSTGVVEWQRLHPAYNIAISSFLAELRQSNWSPEIAGISQRSYDEYYGYDGGYNLIIKCKFD